MSRLRLLNHLASTCQWVHKQVRTIPKHTLNKVILHQYPPSCGIPNISPPCLKLETYLRMTKIPYHSDHSLVFSLKGKMPWIEYKGQKIADSNFCIKFLNKEFAVDLDKDLSPFERGVSQALLRMVEENTYWTLGYYRWIENFDETKRLVSITKFDPITLVAGKIFQHRVRGYLHGHGLGRHSREEVYEIARDDLAALSNCLGEKQFFFGEKPHLIDASVFGLLVSFLWHETGSPQFAFITGDFKNLTAFCVRMKENFWPDWEEAIRKRKVPLPQ